MDLFSFRLLPFLLLCLGCYAGKDILQKGPVEAILERNVTLKVLAEKKSNDTIIWYFRDRDGWINIATLHQTELNITDRYKGRASINSSNGYLTLSYLTCEDSGDYSITIIQDVVITGEITLRVLASTERSTPTCAYPETTQQCAVSVMSLVGCLIVIVLLLVGLLLLLYKWYNDRKYKTSNIEISTTQETKHAVSIYQTLNQDRMSKDQTYSTLHC
ncbi:uncharacterized protein [Leuresthes tenuis]|uniref:uncharacterized protein n=1 Tax=Leuresthes tenuis TaxID=355514 RepID=UPI003B513366